MVPLLIAFCVIGHNAVFVTAIVASPVETNFLMVVVVGGYFIHLHQRALIQQFLELLLPSFVGVWVKRVGEVLGIVVVFGRIGRKAVVIWI